jgi:hypothetical protein
MYLSFYREKIKLQCPKASKFYVTQIGREGGQEDIDIKGGASLQF